MSKDNNFMIIVVIVTIVLLIGILVGFGYYKSHKDFFVYNGKGGEYQVQKVKFGDIMQYKVTTNILLNGKNSEYKMFFRSSPYDVESVTLEPSILRELLLEGGVKKVYVTQDYNLSVETGQMSTVGVIEFNRILGTKEYGLYGLSVQSAFTSVNGNDSSVPAITCDDVKDEIKVIYVTLGDSNRVYMKKKGCVVIEGTDANGILLASDKFAYHLLGVF